MRAPTSPTVVVQVLETSWDKSARGGALAVVRSKLPLSLPLPNVALKSEQNAVIQAVAWSSWNSNFTKAEERLQGALIRDLNYDIRCVRLKLESGQLEVQWTDHRVGAPERGYPSDRNTVVLNDGEWVRCRWNGRFVEIDCGNWWYESITMNVGFFQSRRPEPNVFANTTAPHQIDRLATLF